MIEDHNEDLDRSAGTAVRTSPATLRAMTRVLVGLAVLGLIAVITEVAWLRPRHHDLEQQRADRAAVVAATQRFVTLANTYTPETFEAMTDQVGGLLSTKLRSSFDAANEGLVSVVEQTKLTSTGTVLKTGVASIDDDSAVVLIVADADTTSTLRDSQRHFRWQVDLVKVRGDWLIDDFIPVVDPTLEGAQ
ncbi:MAG TPA: hypothetical protein VLI04_08770 [Nocardioidaceae bacterium]|nr:hypothetical protein [Nocardioidaceae bacterium]